MKLFAKLFKFKFQIAKTNHRDLSDKEWKDMEVILESIDMKSQKDGALTPLDMFRG